MTEKLDETFNIDSSGLIEEHLKKLCEFSDNPDLNEIVKLALNAYADQMKDIQNTEVKYRARLLEVAQQYLMLAKDALVKEQDLQMKREKLSGDREKEKDENPEGKISRVEVLTEIASFQKKLKESGK